MLPSGPLGSRDAYAQVVRPDGSVVRPRGSRIRLPVDQRVLEVARRRAQAVLHRRDDRRRARARVHGAAADRRRRAGRAPARGRRPHAARPHVRARRSSGLGGVALAVWLGLLVARAALTPVKQLTDAAEHVARTRDLTRRIRADRTDELSRLGASFNTMLEALASSQDAQRQLVADASHELRTPLTSLRTNIEVLSSDALPRGGPRAAAAGRGRPARRADGARHRPGRPRARRRAGARSPRTCGSTCWSPTPSSARAATRPTRRSSPSSSPTLVQGVPGPARPRGHQPARQRRQVEPARRPDRGARARRRGVGARPRPRHRRGGPAVRVRPLLPRPARRAACRARASASRSCARSPSRTAARSRPSARTAAARACGCALPVAPSEADAGRGDLRHAHGRRPAAAARALRRADRGVRPDRSTPATS